MTIHTPSLLYLAVPMEGGGGTETHPNNASEDNGLFGIGQPATSSSVMYNYDGGK